MRWLWIACLLFAVSSGFGLQGGYGGPAKTKAAPTDLAKLRKDQSSAKAAFKKKPKDAGLKHRYVVATVKLGTATMMSETLDRKVKYRDALRLYREALKFEPDNHEALNNKDLIESIYRSMGRPIPN